MAIASMQKVMIVAHRSQVADLLTAVQDVGIVQILDAERAMVTIEWPELEVEPRRHRDLEESIDRLNKAIDFLKPYTEDEQTSLFAPRVRVDYQTYSNVISTDESSRTLEAVESVSSQMDKLASEAENNAVMLERLLPWGTLTVPIEELDSLYTSTTFVGLIPAQFFDEAQEKLAELGAALETVAAHSRMVACLGVCLDESASEVQKALRTVDFEAASFEGLSGLVSENIERLRSRQEQIEKEQADLAKQAKKLAKDRLKLQILYDHYENLHSRIHAESTAPATEHAIFLEGWVKKKDYQTLERVVTQYDSCDIAPIEPGKDEEIPVEIDNGPGARPFETITRLYGMPDPSNVDPTVFLAPFFAVFFGVCLTDVAYGLLLMAACWWILKKIQGDKKAFIMLIICGGMAVIGGAITGGWFGDAIQSLLPEGSAVANGLNAMRDSVMLFDPMKDPMIFFAIAVGLGYIQVMFGLFIAFFHNLGKKNIGAALFDSLVWVIFLNVLVLLVLSMQEIIPEVLFKPFAMIAAVCALSILLFSERRGGWGSRIGMGAFQLFSTVFYVGDILSYVRLMALGMVTGGFGMAINVLVELSIDIPVPVLNFVLGALIFVVGHLFNLGMSTLSAFVHTLRLQYVEFFPKFLVGGGHEFRPLRREYKHVQVMHKK